jgi:hypothetical protein
MTRLGDVIGGCEIMGIASVSWQLSDEGGPFLSGMPALVVLGGGSWPASVVLGLDPGLVGTGLYFGGDPCTSRLVLEDHTLYGETVLNREVPWW